MDVFVCEQLKQLSFFF